MAPAVLKPRLCPRARMLQILTMSQNTRFHLGRMLPGGALRRPISSGWEIQLLPGDVETPTGLLLHPRVTQRIMYLTGCRFRFTMRPRTGKGCAGAVRCGAIKGRAGLRRTVPVQVQVLESSRCDGNPCCVRRADSIHHRSEGKTSGCFSAAEHEMKWGSPFTARGEQ
jgi:hypothetical protein